MKYVDEFRDPHKAQTLAKEIRAIVARIERAKQRPLQIMEVCGGHTHTIFRYGIQQLLPDAVEFVHGPGCPVCVLPMGRVDDCVALAERPGVIFTTFGDAMRVPGSKKSLLKAKADGADVRMVYSPLDALKIAQSNPASEVIFFGLGFETTMPSTAMTILQAKAQNLKNFSLFCNHITIIPTVKAILDSPDLHLDGFLGPGRLSGPQKSIYRRLCDCWVIDTLGEVDAFQRELESVGFREIVIEQMQARVTPSVLHVPWVTLKFLLAEVLFGGRKMTRARWNNVLAPILLPFVGFPLGPMAYYIASATRA